MGLFGKKRKIKVPQIGTLTYLDDNQGGILAGRAGDARIGYQYEVYFYVRSNELISGQLEMYDEILDQIDSILQQIKISDQISNEDPVRIIRLLVAEPSDESFDADLNCIQQEKEFSALINAGKVSEIRFH